LRIWRFGCFVCVSDGLLVIAKSALPMKQTASGAKSFPSARPWMISRGFQAAVAAMPENS
jgi:hypothetical protein